MQTHRRSLVHADARSTHCVCALQWRFHNHAQTPHGFALPPGVWCGANRAALAAGHEHPLALPEHARRHTAIAHRHCTQPLHTAIAHSLHCNEHCRSGCEWFRHDELWERVPADGRSVGTPSLDCRSTAYHEPADRRSTLAMLSLFAEVWPDYPQHAVPTASGGTVVMLLHPLALFSVLFH